MSAGRDVSDNESVNRLFRLGRGAAPHEPEGIAEGPGVPAQGDHLAPRGGLARMGRPYQGSADAAKHGPLPADPNLYNTEPESMNVLLRQALLPTRRLF